MTPAEGRESIQRELEAHGIHPGTSAPPIFRLLWAMGVDIPPPHFLGFWTLVILLGGVWASLLGGVTYICIAIPLSWIGGSFPPLLAMGLLVATGFGFGFEMANQFRRTSEEFDLPSWKEYLRSEGWPVDVWKEALRTGELPESGVEDGTTKVRSAGPVSGRSTP